MNAFLTEMVGAREALEEADKRYLSCFACRELTAFSWNYVSSHFKYNLNA